MVSRSEFPLLTNRPDLCYLDNASTAQKPQVVLDALNHFYTHENANTYRGIYELGELATERYEAARKTVAQFLNAAHTSEIIFTRGTTDGINAVADGWARRTLKPGDEIVITELEHHSNWLPWQRLARDCGIVVKVIPVLHDGTLDMQAAQELITFRTKLIAAIWISNAIGTHVPVETLVQMARAAGARILIDAAQAVAHRPVDLQKINADFLVFSGHKIGGPTGVGVLYINKALHESFEPYQLGGGMVLSVDKPTYLPAPHKFEAGTPPIAQAIGLAAAIEYMREHIDYVALQKHEASLCARLIERLSPHNNIRILGPQLELAQRGHLVSFVVDGMHAHDVAAYCAQKKICLRAGHHCAQPLARALGYDASVRASFYVYNTPADVDRLADALDALIAELS
jgi:cysteine desulfurase / selenocysteine lyase